MDTLFDSLMFLQGFQSNCSETRQIINLCLKGNLNIRIKRSFNDKDESNTREICIRKCLTISFCLMLFIRMIFILAELIKATVNFPKNKRFRLAGSIVFENTFCKDLAILKLRQKRTKEGDLLF